MAHSVFCKLARSADGLLSAAALGASYAAVAARHALEPDELRAAASPREARALQLKDPAARRRLRARQEAIYLAVTVFDRPARSVGRAAGVSDEAVRKAVASVEERREDGNKLDRALDACELELMGA